VERKDAIVDVDEGSEKSDGCLARMWS